MALRTVAVSENFFEVLGVPFDARLPWRADMEHLLAIRLSQRTQALGTIEELTGGSFATQDGGNAVIAAVLPRRFIFPAPRLSPRLDALTPSRFGSIATQERGAIRFLTVIARLQPGVTEQAVEAVLSTTIRASSLQVTVEPLDTYMKSCQRRLALGALAASLLIAMM